MHRPVRPTLGALYAARFRRFCDGVAAPFAAVGRVLNRQLAGLTCDHVWRYSHSRGCQVCRHCRVTRPLR